MRFTLIPLFIALLLLAPACGEEKKPAAPKAPAEPGTRGSGEDCVKPEDCQEGLWCLNGRCSIPLNQGMREKREIERVQDERYEQLKDKVRSIEEQMRQ